MKTVIAPVFILWVCTCTFSQSDFLAGSCKYYVGTNDPGAGWQQEEFDDASWGDGTGSIGMAMFSIIPVIPM